MTVAAIKAKGTLIKRGDGGGPETFSTVAEVTNIGGPGLSQEMIETTSHESPNWKDFIPGIAEAGELSLDINYIPDSPNHDATTGLLKDFKDQVDGLLTTPRNYQLVFPDASGTTWTFTAWVMNFEPGANASGTEKLGATVTLKITGEPTLA